MTDTNGNLVESYRYDIYGQPTIFDSTFTLQPSSLVNNRFLFTGREWLPALSLFDYRNRLYSANLGRWLSTDPIGAIGGINLYEYVGNNSVNATDPDGDIGTIIAGAVFGAAFGAASEVYHQISVNPGISTSNIDWNSVARSAVLSGLGGALTGATLGLGEAALAGAFTGAVGGTLYGSLETALKGGNRGEDNGKGGGGNGGGGRGGGDGGGGGGGGGGAAVGDGLNRGPHDKHRRKGVPGEICDNGKHKNNFDRPNYPDWYTSDWVTYR